MSETNIQPAAQKNTSSKEFRRGGDQHFVPLSAVTIDEDFNVRGKNNFGNLDELVQSLKEHGQKEAAFAIKRDGAVVLVTGHRRFTAWHQLVKTEGVATEPEMLIRFVPKNTSLVDLLTLQFTENIKVGNTPYEQALLIQKMEGLGTKQDEITKRLGISLAKLATLKRVLKVDEEVQAYVRTGALSATTMNSIYKETKGDAAAFKEQVDKTMANAKAKGKTKATAADAEVGKTRTTTSILKTFVEKLSAKAEGEKASKEELFALSLFSAVLEKNSDDTIAKKIRAGK